MLCTLQYIYGENANIIVALDGSGNFTSIQNAINSVAPKNQQNVTILIKNGIYNEKIYVTNSHISLVGEDRDSTRIFFAQDRSKWTSANPKLGDYGAATVNIDSNVTDIVFANLTIYNNYVYSPSSVGYAFTMRDRNSCNRVSIINCNIWSDGKDTIALWNSTAGMYYHLDCDFRGYVDAVCPRGWCYIGNSTFYETKTAAMIWHEGVSGTTQKFVLRDGSFDGAPYFQLGNSQGAAVFYLLDCIFSKRMKDAAISGGTKYFYNCHMDSVADYSWLKDNLASAPGSPAPNVPTAKWTFDNVWDPENTMPPVMPFAAIPQPRHKAYAVTPSGLSLKWIAARNANSYNVYLGKTTAPALIKNQTAVTCSAGQLESNTTYYWRVDAITDFGTVAGKLWKFTTGAATGTSDADEPLVKKFALLQNYPNPFNPSTVIHYSLAVAGKVTLKAYNILGNEVASLVNEEKPAGNYSVSFNASSLPSGMYMCSLQAGSQKKAIKMLLVK